MSNGSPNHQSGPDNADVQEPFLETTLQAQELAEQTITQSLQNGVEATRVTLSGALSSSSEDLWRESIANATTFLKIAPLAEDDSIHLLAIAKLETLTLDQRMHLLERQRCYELFDGMKGTDARSALSCISTYITVSYTPKKMYDKTGKKFVSNPEATMVPGMISRILHTEISTFKNFLIAVQQQNQSEVQRLLPLLTMKPLDASITILLRNPEALYEHLLLEEQISIQQTIKYDEWRKCAEEKGISSALDAARSNPPAFLQTLLARRRASSFHARDIAGNAGTPVVRQFVTVGRPEFDLPLVLFASLNEQERAAFRSAVEAESVQSEWQDPYLLHLLQSLDSFESSVQTDGQYMFRADTDALSAVAGSIDAKPGQKPEAKFTRLWKDVFSAKRGQPLGKKLLETIGFIPSGFYGLKAFREDVDFQDVLALHTYLVENQEKSLQLDDVDDFDFGRQKNRILHARWQLLEHFFLGGVAGRTLITSNARQRAISLDAKGIRLDMSPPKNSGNRGELHAHIPYIMASHALLDVLVKEGWITTMGRQEIELQSAWRQNDIAEQKKLEAAKVESFAGAVGADQKEPLESLTLVFTDAAISDTCIRVMRQQKRFPASVTEKYLAHAENTSVLLDRSIQALRLMNHAQSISEAQDSVLRQPLHAGLLMGIVCPVLGMLGAQSADVRRLSAVQWTDADTKEKGAGYVTIHNGTENVRILLNRAYLPARYGSLLSFLCGNRS